ncbi:MAG: hypothetical protein ACFCUE_15730 [Candidatus Bathyarchaeia archaeon]|jgi:hypothetical protein
MKKQQTNPTPQNNPNPTDKLPEPLKTNFKQYTFKCSPTIYQLKAAAALKLWKDRGYRDITFDEPMPYGGKSVYVKVLVRKEDNTMIGVECASTLRLRRLSARIELLRACLPQDSYIIAVFPETTGDCVTKATNFADEVWLTGKNGTVNQMIFSTVFHRK